MKLTNYWLLLVWLAAGGAMLALLCPKKAVDLPDRPKRRWGRLPAALLAAPYVVWAGSRAYFGDTENYRQAFLEAPAALGQIPAYLAGHTKDQGFSVLMILLKAVIGSRDELFFLLVAAFQMYCVMRFFRRCSEDLWLCLFMFVASTDYMSWMFNGMRQFIAVCITLGAFSYMLEKRYVPVIGLILLAATIHGSALLMLPLVFVIQGRAWNWRTLLLIAAVCTAILFMGQFTDVLDNLLAETQYSDIVTNEIWQRDDGTNLLRVLFYSIPALLALWGHRYVEQADSPLVNACVNCSICTAMIYLLSAFSSGIYVGRLPIYTTLQGYAVVPWLLKNMFTKESEAMVRVGLIGGFLMFFYYQMHVTWGIL